MESDIEVSPQLDQEAVRLVEAFGGTASLARLCDVNTQAVSQWKRNGIPKARLQFLRLLRPELFSVEQAA